MSSDKPTSNREYSFFLVKPDGIPKLGEILPYIRQMLGEFEDNQISYYLVSNFSEIFGRLQYEKMNSKPEIMPRVFSEYLMTLERDYGNNGILILLSKKREPEQYVKFLKRIDETKAVIRDKMTDTETPVYYELDRDYFPGKRNGIEERGGKKYVRIQADKARSVIHAPDPKIEDTIVELLMLNGAGIISLDNRLSEESLMAVIDNPREFTLGNMQTKASFLEPVPSLKDCKDAFERGDWLDVSF